MHPLISQLLPENPVTRFAPSPTGYLHLGHVISMAFVFGIGRATGAKVLLRIEDHDKERSRPEYEKAIYDDMAWLDLIPDNWDEFSEQQTCSSFRQSDCEEHYQAALIHLENQKLTYRCTCSRKELSQGSTEQESVYPGICRKKALIPDNDYGIRMLTDDKEESFQDYLLGPSKQNPNYQCGDFLLKDRRKCFTYQFAVVVDDIRHGVNFIIRGSDLIHCTGRQITLMRRLGQTKTPLYLHHPLAIDADGNKLSKRTFAEGIIKRREAGENPNAVLGEALFLAGVLPKKIIVKQTDLPQIFSDYLRFHGHHPK